MLTGDLPTPVKYYNAQIAHEYKKIEEIARHKLIEMLPAELQDARRPLLDEQQQSEEETAILKQADALCAYLKCWKSFRRQQRVPASVGAPEKTLQQRRSEEMDYFIEVFVPSFSLSG